MSDFVWDPWALPNNKEPTTELPDGFIRERYIMGEDVNDIFLALTEIAAAVRLGAGAAAPASAPPTTGTYLQGHIVWNSAAAPGAPSGWICTAAGTPGTWESLAYTAGTVEGAQSYFAEGETLALSGVTESYIGFYPDNLTVRAQVGFTGYPGVDLEENPLDYAEILYLRNLHPDNGHIVLEPGVAGEVYVGNFVTGSTGSMATFGSTRFLAGGSGNMIDATAERIRFPRGSAPPTTGTYALGDLFFNDTSPGSHVGWVCTTAGTPGVWTAFGPPASPTLDHGALFGTLDDDHPQYALADGTRGTFASVGHDHDEDYATVGHDHAATYSALAHNHDATYSLIAHNHDLAYSPTSHNHDLNYSAIGHAHAGVYQPTDADLTAIAALTGTGILERTGDGTWALGSGGEGVEDHGLLTGLGDDDHTQYVLADGTRLITGTQRLGPTSVTGSNWPTRSYALTGDDLVDTIGFAWSIEDGVRNARGYYKVDPANNLLVHDFTYTTGANYEYAWRRDGSELVRFGNAGFTATGINLVFATAGTGVKYPGGDLHTSGTAAPATGTHTQGEVVWNESPTAGGTLGWVCTTAGTPGTWGAISLASGGVSDHGALSGLTDDDHTQYALLTGGAVRGAFTGAISSTGTIRSTAAGIGFDQENGGIRYQSYVGSGLAWMGSYSNHPFGFFTNNGSAQAILETNGALSVGFTAAQSPTSKLLVNGVVEGTALKSSVATGTAPLTVASTTLVANLNADLLDGLSSAAFALAGHDHDATYQPLDSDLTAIAGATLTGDGVLTRTGGVWSIEAGGGGGVTDHGALTGLADDDHTQYLLADGSRALTSLSIAGAINRSTAAALTLGDATTTGVNIGRAGQPNTFTGSQNTFVAADSTYPWRLTDGTHIISFWVGTSGGLECEFGTESNHDLSIYTNNGTPQWAFRTNGDLRLRTTGSSSAGGIQFNSTGARMVVLGTAIPASGTWAVGDIVWNTTPALNAAAGWRCITAGSPGTWRAFGYMHDELTGSATWNPGSVAAAADLGTTVTVTGAAVGDYVLAISHTQLTTQEVVLHGSVTAADTVSVILYNRSAGAVDLASGTLSVIVRKRT